MLLHPEGQPDQAALHLRSALSDAVQLLHAAFIKIRLVRHLDDVAGAQRIAPPEGYHNLHARLRNAPEPPGNAVGKGAVHIFMRNIHDDVCVFSLHLFSASFPYFCAVLRFGSVLQALGQAEASRFP